MKLQNQWITRILSQIVGQSKAYKLLGIGFWIMWKVKPLSHQTALPQRLYSVLKPCQRAVGSPRNTPKNITFASYSVYTTSSQRPYSVHATFLQRLYSVHNVFTAHKQLLQRVHGAYTTFSRRAHSVLKAIIAFKIFYFFIFILSNPFLQT